MPSNRLIHEKSPYLLQHAHNPVDWYAWGPEAFEAARQRQKPILLSIGYSTCHWCHVMAHESFEDEEIAGVLNTHFIPVKVDREERPDIDHIYMTAVSAMTGQGGWPLTVFLTPDAKPFYGGTYYPPYAKWGSPGFKDLLLSVAQAWDNTRADIVKSSDDITDLLKSRGKPEANAQAVEEAEYGRILDTAYHQLAAQFDPQYGGFGKAPKFPMGHNLSFLLRHYERTGEANALHIVEATLTAMMQGGIYDHLGGGFHRYSTDQQWHVPHFEKMLYDQALLVLALIECYQVTGRPQYASCAREVLEYVLRDLSGGEAFYCAEDADSNMEAGASSEAREGAFYVWSEQEIRDVLGPGDAALFNTYYGVKPGGNAVSDPHGEFTGLNILFVDREHMTEGPSLPPGAREKLLARRNQRPRPHLDDKVLSDWNGLMIAAFALAGSALGEERYIEAARRAADFILRSLKTGDTLHHRWRDGGSSIDGMLDDYAFFIFGLCQVHEAVSGTVYLDAAVQLADTMIARFADPEQGGFFMTAAGTEGLIVRPQDIYDGAIPSGNSMAGHVLLKLHALTGREDLLLQAQRLWRRFMPIARQAPHAYTFFLSAVDMYMRGPVDIKLSGAPGDADIANLKKVVYKHFIPRRVFTYARTPGPWSVVVCRKGVCLPKVSDVAALDKALGLS